MRKEKEENMEQTILKVAEQLFLEKGFAMTSTTEIARQAGCNQALVHYYFRTKENLFQKIFEEKLYMLIRDFGNIESRELTFEERLRLRIEAHFDLIARNPRLPFLVLNEIMTNPQRIEALKQVLGDFPKKVYERFQDDLNREIDAGRIRPVTVPDLVMNIVSMNAFPFLTMPLFQNIFDLSQEEKEAMLRRRKREVVTTILNGLRP